MKNYMKKRMGIMIISTMLVLVLVVGCGSRDYEMTTDSVATTEATSANYGEADYEDVSFEMEGEMKAIALEESPMEDVMDENSSNMSTNELLENRVDSRKYIRTFRYYIETLEFDEAQYNLEKLVDLNFGFFQSTSSEGISIYNQDRMRSANFTIRIPKEKVDEFIEGLNGIGNVTDSNSMVEDVTSQYFDTEARIRTLEVQEERLIEILKNAEDLEYVLELERELSDVRYEIERFESTFRNLKDQINYSTISVNLNEVEEETVVVVNPKTFSEKMSTGFGNTINDIVDFFANLFLALVVNSPIIIIWIVIILIVYRFVVKRIFSKKSLKIGKKNSGVKESLKENVVVATKEVEDKDE